ncbi:MAG: flavin reductase family protein [Dissulfurimicrobium sp.]|uniref:flavin reductase family protein n=1 Tax=Dissulfurimicrobium sp. TaxID=2022436 RepID=UPI0040496279
MQEKISRTLPTGVYIVTARDGDRINGMTAAWASQVSFKPPLVAVSIAEQRFTYGLIKKSGQFCINAMAEDGIELARSFGFKSGRSIDKFKGIDYTLTTNGLPILSKAFAYMECKVVNTFETGDHTLFIGSVSECLVTREDAKPLIFAWDDFFGKKKGDSKN